MAVPSPEISKADLDAVRQTARSHAIDRYLAALLAPRTLRADLIALAAFAGEIERVPLQVSDAALGEIRLKWWLDWLEDLDLGLRTGNPVADVFADVVRRRGLSRSSIRSAIDARGQELYAAPFANGAEYDDFLTRTEGALFQVAGELTEANSQKVNAGAVEGEAPRGSLVQFGKAYGGVKQLLRLPFLTARGRWVLLSDRETMDATMLAEQSVRSRADVLRADAIAALQVMLEEARTSAGRLSGTRIVAGLPAALVGPYLKALERQDDWLVSGADIPPLTRLWQLWRAYRSRKL